MSGIEKASVWRVSLGFGALLFLSGCGQSDQKQGAAGEVPGPTQRTAPASIPMGGNKSVTRFFVTSKGLGKGGNLGGLAGADAHCQALAQAQGAGDHTWRAYLSTEATDTAPAVNARDRIGAGPWYNAEGDLIAQYVAQLHGALSRLGKETAVTESADEVNPDQHEILTGSRPDGTAFPASKWVKGAGSTGWLAYPDDARSRRVGSDAVVGQVRPLSPLF